MREVRAANVCTGQAAQCISDNVLFTGLIPNIQPELVKELRRPNKTEVHPHGGCCQRDRRLLEDIQNGQVIVLNNDVDSKRLN